MEHGEFLRSVTGNLQEVLDLRRWRQANFDATDRAMLGYAETFTFESHRIRADHLAQLRDVGFTDPQIIDITLCAAYRHYITRVADATGIDVDPQLGIAPILVEAYSHARAVPAAGGSGDPAAVKDGPWIAVADRPEDDSILAPVWSAWRAERGMVPGLFLALSLRPRAVGTLDALWRLACFGGSPMGPSREAWIGVTVGARLRSPWLLGVYRIALRRAIGNPPGTTVAGGWREADLPAEERAVLGLVEQITDDASAIVRGDVDRLREAGLADAEILDVIVASALLNGVGRMANALGVPPDVDPRGDVGGLLAVYTSGRKE